MKKKVATILYVDDNDLLHVNMERQETLDEAFEALQESITSWGRLLIATGSAEMSQMLLYTDWISLGQTGQMELL